MSNLIDKMLHLAMAGQWADAELPSVVSEDEKAKAKKLLKTNKMAKGEDEHARGMRAYFRAVASGRDAEYLLTQKGKVGEGAQHAKKLLGEAMSPGAGGFERAWNVFRYLTQDMKVNTVGTSSNRPDDHWGIHPKYLKKIEQKGFIKIIPNRVKLPGGKTKLIRGESAWMLLKKPSGPVSEDFSAADLDKWWSEARPKLVKGSRATRLSRMNGCIKSLQALRDGGVQGDGMSKDQLNPVPKKERDTEDQPKDDTPGVVDEDTIEEMTMTTFRSYGDYLRSLDEANISAPAVSQPLAGGGKQFSSKSKFKGYAGPGKTYTGDSASIPADKDAKGAEPYYPAVKGPVGPDAREYVDVRVEDMDPNTLIGLIEQIAEAADSLEEFAQLLEQHLGFDAVIANLSECDNVDDAEALVGRIFEHAHADHGPEHTVETEQSLREKGMGIDDFDVHADTWDEDLEFAAEMMGEANISAPAVSKKTPDGKSQLSPKSRFRQPYKGPGEKYDGEAASIPADKEPQSADAYYGKATGQGADGREEVDVRIEDAEAFARTLTYPTKAMKDR